MWVHTVVAVQVGLVGRERLGLSSFGLLLLLPHPRTCPGRGFHGRQARPAPVVDWFFRGRHEQGNSAGSHASSHESPGPDLNTCDQENFFPTALVLSYWHDTHPFAVKHHPSSSEATSHYPIHGVGWSSSEFCLQQGITSSPRLVTSSLDSYSKSWTVVQHIPRFADPLFFPFPHQPRTAFQTCSCNLHPVTRNGGDSTEGERWTSRIAAVFLHGVDNSHVTRYPNPYSGQTRQTSDHRLPQTNNAQQVN